MTNIIKMIKMKKKRRIRPWLSVNSHIYVDCLFELQELSLVQKLQPYPHQSRARVGLKQKLDKKKGKLGCRKWEKIKELCWETQYKPQMEKALDTTLPLCYEPGHYSSSSAYTITTRSTCKVYYIIVYIWREWCDTSKTKRL